MNVFYLTIDEVETFVVEHYQVVLLDAYRQAEQSMIARLRSLCAAQIPGDTYRNLQIDPTFSGRTFKHILVPVWLDYHDPYIPEMPQMRSWPHSERVWKGLASRGW